MTLTWGALSFHWTVLTNNILPTRALQFADETTKGSVLGWVTVAGALVATLTGPIIGVLSDRSRSRWGRRRPFRIAGMLLNVPALCALLAADSLAGFVLGYMAVQFWVNVASGPATALIPDQVPRVQQGQATGVAGLADVVGRMTGSLAGGLLIAAPTLSGAIAPWLGILPAALRSEPMLPLVGLLVAVTVGSMLVTAATVREAPPALVSARRGERLWRPSCSMCGPRRPLRGSWRRGCASCWRWTILVTGRQAVPCSGCTGRRDRVIVSAVTAGIGASSYGGSLRYRNIV